MAVSRRLRYEILRRDNHQCRYCGASAPDAKLTIDHVVPTALGGSDEASNLVAACKDCNAGKSSMPADAAIVADVKADALRWAKAMEVVVNARAEHREERDQYVERFDEAWRSWCYHESRPIQPNGPSQNAEAVWSSAVGQDVAEHLRPIHYSDGRMVVRADSTAWKTQGRLAAKTLLRQLNEALAPEDRGLVANLSVIGPNDPLGTEDVQIAIPRPANWEQTLWQFHKSGLPIEEVEDAVKIACGNSKVSTDQTWRYFCGVCWKRIDQIREAASDVVITLEGDE